MNETSEFIEVGTKLIRVDSIAYVEILASGYVNVVFGAGLAGKLTVDIAPEHASAFLAVLRSRGRVLR